MTKPKHSEKRTQTRTEEQKQLMRADMLNRYPMLTLLFESAFNSMAHIPITQEMKGQAKTESQQFFNEVISLRDLIHNLSDEEFEQLSDEEYQLERGRLNGLIYFADLMQLFADNVAKMPTASPDFCQDKQAESEKKGAK